MIVDDYRSARSEVARATHLSDHQKAREAAYKAWDTIRNKKRELEASKSARLTDYEDITLNVPPGVATAKIKMKPPLIRPSKLTYVDKGGIGKELSDGWALNFAVGCTHGCIFCYVDEIHKKFSFQRAGNVVYEDWGNYFAVPDNMDELIASTSWGKWRGEEVLLSSTHDPYLPQLSQWTRRILESALPEGVKFCIQTRSPLVEKDFPLLTKYKNQVRIQVSIATMDERFARVIEPRVVSPKRRLEILRKAKDAGLETGVIVAPVFPKNRLRPSVNDDLESIMMALGKIRPDHVYGESLHMRGINLVYVERALEEEIKLDNFDDIAQVIFKKQAKAYGLKATWWPEHHKIITIS